MNPSPSPIASPIPARTTASPFQAALAAQIEALTHSVDRLEQLLPLVSVYQDSIQREIDTIHSTIDALNALYDTAGNIQLDTDSLTRRLRVNQQAAEKHHEGNRAACERENELRAVLENLLNCPDLNLQWLEPETEAAIEAARSALD